MKKTFFSSFDNSKAKQPGRTNETFTQTTQKSKSVVYFFSFQIQLQRVYCDAIMPLLCLVLNDMIRHLVKCRIRQKGNIFGSFLGQIALLSINFCYSHSWWERTKANSCILYIHQGCYLWRFFFIEFFFFIAAFFFYKHYTSRKLWSFCSRSYFLFT